MCVGVLGGGGSGATLLVIIEGGGPELELGKDWRRLLSLVPQFIVYCSSDSDGRSWFLAIVLMTLDPMWKDSGFFHLV